jgi:hypothetical protein
MPFGSSLVSRSDALFLYGLIIGTPVMAERDEKVRAKLIVQVVCVVTLLALGVIDSQPNVEVPQLIYYIIGGVALGVSDLRALLGNGGSDDKKH